MRYFTFTAVLALLPALGWGQTAGDPLKSPECGQARDALEAARQAKPAQNNAQIEALRKKAASVCLGFQSDQGPSVRAPLPAPTQPITTAPMQRPPVFAAPAITAPQVVRAPVITSCDPTGCWDSNGTRLNRSGPNLIGPTGVCSVQANLLTCPP